MFRYQQALGRAAVFEKIRNSFLQLHFLYPIFVRNYHYDIVLAGGLPGHKLNRGLARLLWFWPRISDAVIWARGDFGDERTPENFKDLSPAAVLLLDTVEKLCPDRSARILDLGCNMGRHLGDLHNRGYRRLAGVDVMGAALKAFAEHRPRVYAASDVRHDLFQRYLTTTADQSFDLVYTHGATVELVHPSFDVIRHLCRIARDHVVLLIHEYELGYPRFWALEFALRGFLLTRALRPVDQDLQNQPLSAASLLVFRRLPRS
jgi:SAM-dependent methyltransferase